MRKLTFDISVSLDGSVAGPNATLEEPLGKGGEQLHEWVVATESWRRSHGLEGGETGTDADLMDEVIRAAGATIMGRKMFSGGAGPWETDPNPDGWWGEEPPFRHPVFVLTHHRREPLELKGTTFTFVTDGIEAALESARDAAGDKDVAIGGGANVIQQYLRAGEVDEFQIHIAPVFLGAGVPLFHDLPSDLAIEPTRTIGSPRATHVRYRVTKTKELS